MDNQFSLLWPSESMPAPNAEPVLSAEAMTELGLDKLCKFIGGGSDERVKSLAHILARMPTDTASIAYRQGIFRDMCDTENIDEIVEDILKCLADLSFMTNITSMPEDLSLWRLFTRINELEVYVHCKTVYTVAYGAAQVLYQSGVFVPAETAVMSHVDCVFAHFPATESETGDLGRLGEEATRLREIFERATSRSLILLNESLSTTNAVEGFYIALDVVRALSELGARVIYNTHMHDLAERVQATAENGFEGVVSMTTGVEDGTRTFKVFPGPPLGVSYAGDIARRYGISYGQLREVREGASGA